MAGLALVSRTVAPLERLAGRLATGCRELRRILNFVTDRDSAVVPSTAMIERNPRD
jgi:hypothetical protein